MTEISLFKDAKPSWETVTFNEDISRVPHMVRRYRNDDFIQDAVYTSVIGENLVYRRFEMDCRLDHSDGIYHVFSMTPNDETERYVFGKSGLFLEKADKTITLITPDRIDVEDLYDTQIDTDAYERRLIFRDFLHKVVIPHKELIIQGLNHVRNYPQLGFAAFIEIYSKAIEDCDIGEDVPKRIRNELNTRNHPCGKAIKIAKDLVVVTGGVKCRYLDITEQTRVYFDSTGAYYFRQNAVTQRWKRGNLLQNEIKKDGYYIDRMLTHDRLIDIDVFDNTFAERFARSAVEKRVPNGQRVNYVDMLAQLGFLSAEQAAKMNSPVYNVILRNIYEGKIVDGNQPLDELLGISGAQIKFLNEVDIPENIEEFALHINDTEFKDHFPDIKKRIFAVAFYLGDRNRYYPGDDVTKEEVFEAAQTLNSLENTDHDKRRHQSEEYKDYIRMLRNYRLYVRHMQPDDPLKEEILKFGEFPLNMKPSRISDCHNKLGRLIEIIRCSDQITHFTAAIAERKQKEAKEIEYTDGTYSIIMPDDAEDIIREGRELDHCVGRAGYIERMANGVCRILFLRKNDDLLRPLITIEERDGVIRQCYGYRDGYNKDPKIRDFIKEYAAIRVFRIECVIFSAD